MLSRACRELATLPSPNKHIRPRAQQSCCHMVGTVCPGPGRSHWGGSGGSTLGVLGSRGRGWVKAFGSGVSTQEWQTHRGVRAGSRPSTGVGQAGWLCQTEAGVVGFSRQPEGPWKPPFGSCCGGKAHSPPAWFPLSPRRTAGWLFVGPQEPRHFGTQKFDKGPGEHLL